MSIRLMLSSALLVASLPVLAQTSRPIAARSVPRSAPATAQPATNDASIQSRADALTSNMAQGLGLTAAQTEKVREINLRSVRNVEAARQHYRQDPTKLRAYIDEVGVGRLEQLKDVLSPAQFQRYQQKREQKMGIPSMRSNQGNQPPGLPNNGPGDN